MTLGVQKILDPQMTLGFKKPQILNWHLGSKWTQTLKWHWGSKTPQNLKWHWVPKDLRPLNDAGGPNDLRPFNDTRGPQNPRPNQTPNTFFLLSFKGLGSFGPPVSFNITLAKSCLNPLTPLKVIVSTARIHVRPYVKTARQTGENFYFLITYGVCKKRKYCNRMSEKKKNSLLLTNVYDFYVLEDKTS